MVEVCGRGEGVDAPGVGLVGRKGGRVEGRPFCSPYFAIARERRSLGIVEIDYTGGNQEP